MKNGKNIERKLKERMEGYIYGQMNLLKGNFKWISHEGNSLSIKNFYSGPGKAEVCNNQAEFYRQKNSDLNLIRVAGEEPLYFNGENSTHCFLMFPQKKLPRNFWRLDQDERKTYLLASNPLIVDPSFQKVIPVASSGYNLNEVLNNKFSSKNFLNLSAKPGHYSAVPLGITKQKELVSLGIYDEKPWIFFKDEKLSGVTVYTFGNSALKSRLKKDPILGEMIQILGDKYNNFKEN